MSKRPRGGGPPPDGHPRRCHATAKGTGRQCRAWAIEGTDPPVCRSHGGAAPQVRAAASRRTLEAAALTEARRMVARAGVDDDPITHLLDSLYLAAAQVAVWGAMVADLDDAAEVDLKGTPDEGPDPARIGRLRGETWWESVEAGTYKDGTPKYVLAPQSDRLIVQSREGVARLHPFVEQYERWVDRRAKYAKLAIDAGVAERLVAIRETEAERMVAAFDRALTDPAFAAALGFDGGILPHAARAEGRRAMARHLRAVADDGTLTG